MPLKIAPSASERDAFVAFAAALFAISRRRRSEIGGGGGASWSIANAVFGRRLPRIGELERGPGASAPAAATRASVRAPIFRASESSSRSAASPMRLKRGYLGGRAKERERESEGASEWTDSNVR